VPPAPLIVTLHGSGRNGKILIEHWAGLAQKEGIVLAGPDALTNQYWSSPVDGPSFLHDVIEAIKVKTAIDPRCVYLFGHSAGAGFALQMAMLESEYLAAIAIHAGALPPSDYRLTSYAVRKIPIWMTVGTEDPFFPLPQVRATRDVLQKEQFPVELVEIPHHTHDYYSRSRSINDAVWQFLSKQSLQSDPKYARYAE